MQLPFVDMYKLAGIFIFKEHVFIHHSLLAQNINSNEEMIVQHCCAELEKDTEERPKFIELMKSILGDSIEEWALYKIPNVPESSDLLSVLARLKAVPIESYEKDPKEKKGLEFSFEEIVDLAGDEEMIRASRSPGLFYASLVDESRKSKKEKCWLLK